MGEAQFFRYVWIGLIAAAAFWFGGQFVQNVFLVSAEQRAVTPRGDLAGFEQTAAAVFEAAAPSVVYIYTQRQNVGRFGPAAEQGAGSGFVWDRAGHVITNYHVVGNADRVFVRFETGNGAAATVVGTSPDHDLAVLRVARPANQLFPVAIGRSSSLQIGHAAFAIGNPFGLARTLTTGVISALDRTLPTETAREITGVIQTDAAINPGNSGGPLLDSAARLIGVNTAIVSGTGAYSGIGFAVPVDTVNRVVPQIIATGKIARPGIGIQAATEEVSARFGVTGVAVVAVEPGGPAAKAGLEGMDPRTGQLADVIVAVEGKDVETLAQLAGEFERIGIGNETTLTVQRDGETREVVLPIVDISG